jgi:hypothetical protein
MDDTAGLKIAGVFAVVGVGLLIAAGYFIYTANQLVIRGETTVGTVVDFRQERGLRRVTGGRGNDASNFHWYRVPIIEFRSQDGQPIMFSALHGELPEEIVKGAEVEVAYLPANPTVAAVKGSTRLSDGAVILAIFGGASLVPGVVMLVPVIRRRRRIALAARYERKRR